MQLRCLRVIGKILAMMMLISSTSCAFILEDRQLSKSFLCERKKCCYNIKTQTTQICGSSSGEDIIIIIIHHN